MNVVGFIFARGGSKGLPRKNIRPLLGKTLLQRAVECAQACSRIGRVIVSTDDAEMAGLARQYGAEVPFLRPSELASDTASEMDSWKHALQWCSEHAVPVDIFVSLPATAPLRVPADIEACLDLLTQEKLDLVLTGEKARRSPYFNMVRRHADGTVGLLSPGVVVRRQDAPEAYDVSTVCYAARAEYVQTLKSIWDGRVGLVEVPPQRAVDIDHEIDLELAEFYLRKRSDPQ